MKTKLILLYIFIFLGQLLSAQTFTEVSPAPPFDGIQFSSVAFSDVDGDNDQDVLITGENSSFAPISKLYTNDGAGNFTEVLDTPFDGVSLGSVIFFDVDGDNDQDVLITGYSGSFDRISKLYTNDGIGNFTEVQNTPFDGANYSSVAFSDVDGDNDQDVLITGVTGFNRSSKLYTNDGVGNFTEVLNTPFDNIWLGSVTFSDVDGDNDQDVLITGENSSNDPISKLYTNDGAGNFTEVLDTPLDGVWFSSVAFSDVDGDNDQDVLITGLTGSGRISKLYTNDGAGSFTEVLDTPFERVSASSIAFVDIDGDNDQDVLITGNNSSSVRISKLYTNDGAGNFTEVLDTPFDGAWFGSVVFSDVDGDNDQDVLITGENSSYVRISKLYTNDGAGNFTEVLDTPFDGAWFGSVVFSDVDGDNDQDVLITGENNSGIYISKLYTNDGMTSSLGTLFSILNFEFMLYPNPTKANQINVNYSSNESGWVNISLFDLEGRLLNQYQERMGVGEQSFSINISSLKKGHYIIQLDDGLRKGIQELVIQ